LTQFEKGTGMKRANVCATLKALVVKRLLLKSENGYKPNKNYDEWLWFLDYFCKRRYKTDKSLDAFKTRPEGDENLKKPKKAQKSTHDILSETYWKTE